MENKLVNIRVGVYRLHLCSCLDSVNHHEPQNESVIIDSYSDKSKHYLCWCTQILACESIRFSSPLISRSGTKICEAARDVSFLRAKRPQRRRASRNGCFRKPYKFGLAVDRFWFVLLLQIFVPDREIYGFSVSGELTTSVANKENINIGFVLFNSLDQMNRYAKPELIALDMRTWTLNLPFDVSHICKI